LIGIISTDAQKEIVKEFFELFKTPWEFFKQNRHYDVVVCTDKKYSEVSTKLLLIYCGELTEFDKQNQVSFKSKKAPCILEYKGSILPVYGETISFERIEEPVIRCKETEEVAGFEIIKGDTKILRIGFNLFDEVSFLLSQGQPKKYSLIPTLDVHISLLREWILNANIPVVEIPPVPAGYEYVCCLTHDIDFAGIRNHNFDHTFFGFVYRASLGSFIDLHRGRGSLKKLLKNLKAVLLLPAVYLGMIKDFWFQFDAYREIEKDAPSTFFFIPFKNEPGQDQESNGEDHNWRATKYDVSEIAGDIRNLKSLGCEIGVHGIDAWMNSEKGRRELNRISEISGDGDMGVRMHWLYFNHESPRILEAAGFYYDSSLGYNDAAGYRNGTTQAFRPIGVQRLLELPLNVQDSALFYPGRMGLSEEDAASLVDRLIENSTIFGGVLTINWHDRSLAPERLWGDFYIEVLKKINKKRVWFGTGQQVIQWFNKRRACCFGETHYTSNMLKLSVKSDDTNTAPALMIRVYLPEEKGGKKGASECEKRHIDFSFSSYIENEIILN
jgi:hypothetical protein